MKIVCVLSQLPLLLDDATFVVSFVVVGVVLDVTSVVDVADVARLVCKCLLKVFNTFSRCCFLEFKSVVFSFLFLFFFSFVVGIFTIKFLFFRTFHRVVVVHCCCYSDCVCSAHFWDSFQCLCS